MTTPVHSQALDMKPVSRQPLYRQAQAAIKAYIVDNQLHEGDSLPPEGKLAEALGISRNSVREAVKSLEVLGVLEARVGSGLFVRAFTFDPIFENLSYALMPNVDIVKDLLDLRYVLDLGLIDRLIEAATPAQVTHLQSIIEDWKGLARQGLYDAELDRSFHMALYSELSNPLLSQLSGVFWDAFEQVMEQTGVVDVTDPVHTMQLHEAIVAALANRDHGALRHAVDAHYPGIWGRLLDSSDPKPGEAS